MAKITFNPDKEVTIEDRLIEKQAMGIILGYVKEAMEAKELVESQAEDHDKSEKILH